MANQQNSYTGSQGTGTNSADFSFTFPSFTTGEVKVEVDNVVKTLTTHYTVENYNTTSGGTVRFTTGNIPTGTTPVRIFRQTNVDSPKAEFQAGSSLKAQEINDSFKQVRHALQEAIGANATDRKIQPFNIEDGAITSAAIKDLTIARGDIANDAIDGTKIADDSVDSEHIVADSLDTEHYAPGSVDNTALGADAVTNAKIADDQIDSEHYVDLSVDTQHIANEQVTTAKLGPDAVVASKIADDQINSEHYVAGSIDHEHLANDIIDGDNIQDDVINSEHYVAGSIDHEHLANDIIDGDNIQDNVINSEHYVDGSIDHEHLANDIIDGDNIQDDVVNSEHIAAGALDNEHYAAGSITSDKLNAATVITASEQSTATANDTSFLTSAAADARFFNISSGDTIKDGQTFPDNDTTIATTAAINDRIIDIVNDVGGFDIVESEQHFPNTNPQGQAGSAAVLSIKAASANLVPSGTTLTITNGNLADNADITITGVTSTIPSGFGFIVESTGTLHTYTFHRLVPKATEVTTVAGKATEIGRLGTAAAVEDMSILGTTDAVADMAILGTADVVSDMNTLGTADVVADMNTLAVTSVVNNMDTVATNVANVNTTAGSISNVNTTAGSIANVNTVAGSIANVNTTAGSIANVNTTATNIANVNTTATNITDVNTFANRYRIASSEPGTNNDEGDLYFDTSANELRVYNGTAWQGGVTATGNLAGTGANSFTGNQTIQNTAPTLFLTDTNNNDDFSVKNDNGTFKIIDETDSITRFSIHSNGTITSFNNHDFSAGIDVTGNITVTGNVDGRDVAADGVNLDTIRSGEIGTTTTNGNIKLEPNGTGVVEVRGAGGNDGTLQLNCSAQSHGIKLKSPPHSAGQSYTLTFPSSIVNNGALKTDSSGNLSFGLITNTNVDASAAIAGTKISPDFGSQNITTTGDLNAKDITLTDGSPAINFTDNDANPDYQLQANAGNFYIKDVTNGQARLQVNSDGHVDVSGNLDVGAGLDVTGEITSTSHLDMPDDAKIKLGTGDDLQIYHNGSDSEIKESTGNLNILCNSSQAINLKHGSENMLRAITDGAVELYFDSSKKFETTSAGVDITGQMGSDTIHIPDGSTGIQIGNSNDLRLYHDGSNSVIKEAGTGDFRIQTNSFRLRNEDASEMMISADADGAVYLAHNGTSKLETTSDGLTVSGAALFADNSRIKLGGSASSPDTQLWHDGSNTYIHHEGTGDLIARIAKDNGQFKVYGNGNTSVANFKDNAEVELFYNGAQKLETTNTGISVTGTVAATSYTGDGSNLTGVSQDLVSDTTPQLGGHLDVSGQDIVTTSNADIDLIPNGSGQIVTGGTTGLKLPVGTTAQRVNTEGLLRYNSESNKPEYYDGNNWIPIETPPTLESINNTNPTTTQIASGFDLVLTGANFTSGATVKFIGNDGTQYTSPTVTVNSTSQITARVPSGVGTSNEPYDVRVSSQAGSQSTLENAMNVNATPSWSTASGTLATIGDTATGNHATIAASDPDGGSITYSGSVGGGLSLSSSGVISGNPTDVTSSTTLSFTATATDSEGAAVNRSFNIIVNPVIDGSTAAKAGTSAAQIKSNTGTTTNGVYWIKPSGVSSAYQAYCNMNIGGGIILAAKINADSSGTSNSSYWRYNSNLWTSNNSYDGNSYNTVATHAKLAPAQNFPMNYFYVTNSDMTRWVRFDLSSQTTGFHNIWAGQNRSFSVGSTVGTHRSASSVETDHGLYHDGDTGNYNSGAYNTLMGYDTEDWTKNMSMGNYASFGASAGARLGAGQWSDSGPWDSVHSIMRGLGTVAANHSSPNGGTYYHRAASRFQMIFVA